ncbi:MAG: sigma-70 family RNA polymerase sigma factor [Lentisphaeria bacterium]|nr:sigma-70 family RNA polymerase sigma factor [Lentisphaeria bacterium]MBR3505920.1 sigma-70 family RNA polymerase sigma factor [Lentisphaeria bacterium]
MEQEQKTREEALLKAFRSGDDTAFDALIGMYSAKLYKVAYALLGSRQDAEEVVQDTFLRAYRALAAFRGESSLETWLHRITLNLARNKYQWNHRRGSGVNVSLTAGDGDGADSGTDNEQDIPDRRMEPDVVMEQDEIGTNIMKALNRLPDNLRETMLLRHVNDMPYEQIAQKLDCKVGTVKSRLSRGREMLRDYLAAVGILPSPGGAQQ